MENQSVRSGTFVFGGLFIGIWLYVTLFGLPALEPDVMLWNFWGFVGLVVAGGLYASRVVNQNVRIGLWVALGIGVGMLAAAALLNNIGEAFAGILTFLGGLLIVTAIPSEHPEGFVQV